MTIKIIRSNYTNTGAINLDEAIYKAALQGQSVVLADKHSLTALPEFIQICQKNDVESFAVGASFNVKFANYTGEVTFLAKNNNGLVNIRRAIEKLDVYDQSHNAAIPLSSLEGEMADTYCVVGMNSPIFVAERTRNASLIAKVRSSMAQIVEKGVIYEHYSSADEYVERYPNLQAYNKYIESNFIHGAIPVSIASFDGQELTRRLAIARYMKSTKVDFVDAEKMFPIWHKNVDFKPCHNPTLTSNLKNMLGNINSNYNVLRSESIDDIGVNVDITKLARKNLNKYLNDNPTYDARLYINRLNEELAIIKETGFEKYFQLLVGFSEFCRERGIPLGVRGSAVSSLVVYVSGLSNSQVDPVLFNLDKRRFMGKHRMEVPDVDIEIPEGHRELFFDYIKSKIPQESVSMLATVERVNKMSRALEIAFIALKELKDGEGNFLYPLSEKQIEQTTNQIRNTVNKEFGKRSFNDMDVDEILDKSKSLSKIAQTNNTAKIALTCAKITKGWSLYLKNHPTGVIVDLSKDRVVPFVKNREGRNVAQLNGNNSACAGYVKYDCISSKILRGLHEADLILAKKNLSLNISDIMKSNNPKKAKYLFDFLLDNNFMINQVSRPFGASRLKEVKPSNFTELVAFYALVRPAVTNDDIKNYINPSEKNKSNPFSDKVICKLLERSRGTPIYDEQILQLATEVGKLTDAQADELRTAIKKPKSEHSNGNLSLFDALREPFIQGAISDGRTREVSEKIFTKIQSFHGKYFFNESHSYAYAALGLKQLLLKYQYPEIFYQVFVRDMDHGKKNDMIEKIVSEYGRRGIVFSRPNINISEKSDMLSYSYQGKGYILPALKTCGVTAALIDSIIKLRNKALFIGVKEAFERIVYDLTKTPIHSHLGKKNKTEIKSISTQLERLALLGAFDTVGISPEIKLGNMSIEEKRNVIRSFIESYSEQYIDTSPILGRLKVSKNIKYDIESIMAMEHGAFRYSPLESNDFNNLKTVVISDTMTVSPIGNYEPSPVQYEKRINGARF